MPVLVGEVASAVGAQILSRVDYDRAKCGSLFEIRTNLFFNNRMHLKIYCFGAPKTKLSLPYLFRHICIWNWKWQDNVNLSTKFDKFCNLLIHGLKYGRNIGIGSYWRACFVGSDAHPGSRVEICRPNRCVDD